MQFDKDLNSPHAELFLEVRRLVLEAIGAEAREQLKDNITSYFSPLGGVCYLKTRGDGVRIGWFRGAHIADVYGVLGGQGKTLRGQSVRQIGPTERAVIREYTAQTIAWLLNR